MAGVVTVWDAKAYLNIQSTTDDDELGQTLADAVAAIENLVGPLATRTVSEEIDEHTSAIVLTYTPVLSVSSISIEPWLGAAAIDDTAAWRLNPMTGVLRRKVVGGTLPFYGRGSIFTVTYVVGRTDVPAPINRAVLIQTAALWKSQRGAKPLPAGGDSPPPVYMGAMGFLAPEVMELLQPYQTSPGVA